MVRSISTWPVVGHASPAYVIVNPRHAAHHVFATGIGVVSTGHCHPKVVKAIQDQASEFIIAQQNIFTSSPAMVSAIFA